MSHIFSQRVAFYSARRHGGESPRSWARRLRALADKCAFSEDVLHQVTKDIFVVGFGPGTVGDRLLEEDSGKDMKMLVKIAEDAIALDVASNNQYRDPKPSTSYDSTTEDSDKDLSDADPDYGFNPEAESSRCGLENAPSIENLTLNDTSVDQSNVLTSTEDEDTDEEIEEDKPQKTKKKWTTLEHNGPCFPQPYKKLPIDIKLIYDGKEVTLSENAEEIATLYAKILNRDANKPKNHKHTIKSIFNENFFSDWTKVMTENEKDIIKDLKKCDFSKICTHFQEVAKEQSNNSKIFKQLQQERYGYCYIDRRTEKIQKFTIAPPSILCSRGETKTMGKIKKRIKPEDVIINCTRDKIPPLPVNRSWKKVQHDQNSMWLAKWKEMEDTKCKFTTMKLSPVAKPKQQTDKDKYEIARKLGTKIEKIRKDYRKSWQSDDVEICQRGVALFLLDELALRAGYDTSDGAQTVACCSLRVKHIQLQRKNNEYLISFNFTGKDIINYKNTISVEKLLFDNFQKFTQGKEPTDKLFDHITPTILNTYLKKYDIPGLTVKVFRTYRACKLLETKLNKLTDSNIDKVSKLETYRLANRAVAILCNHQTSQKNKKNSDTSEVCKQIKQKHQDIDELTQKINNENHNVGIRVMLRSSLIYLKAQLKELEKQKDSFKYCDDNKIFTDETSKMNYLDPRITIAWCVKHDISYKNKDIYNEREQKLYQWAIEDIEEDFVF